MADKIKLKDLTVPELTHKLSDFKEELRNLRFSKVIGQVANTGRLRVLRRSIARISTILKEYALGIRKPRETKDK
jgi:large subunit ribosomal protein L29